MPDELEEQFSPRRSYAGRQGMFLDSRRRGAVDLRDELEEQLPKQNQCGPTRGAPVRQAPRGGRLRD